MNRVTFILEQKHTDFNGHVSEAGYLTIANEAIWQVFNSIGLSHIFLAENIGPIIFDTHMEFKAEAMEGDKVTIHFKAKLSDDSRKIFRDIDIINQNGQIAVKIKSNGAFLDLKKRRVVSASERISRKFSEYLSD
tara:strand:- start:804 stop:1208 length:405 start_codon:yes stop_codon:yes gene_type:complete